MSDINTLRNALKGLLEIAPNHCHTSSSVENYRKVVESCNTCRRVEAAKAALAQGETNA